MMGGEHEDEAPIPPTDPTHFPQITLTIYSTIREGRHRRVAQADVGPARKRVPGRSVSLWMLTQRAVSAIRTNMALGIWQGCRNISATIEFPVKQNFPVQGNLPGLRCAWGRWGATPALRSKSGVTRGRVPYLRGSLESNNYEV